MNILIPAAGLGRRMKSYGPKALVSINNETVIGRLIRLSRKVYPDSRIVVVAGFEADKVRKALPKDVRVVTNPYYEVTNVAYSICLGLHYCPPRHPTLVIYGDLVFNDDAIKGLDKLPSCVILDPTAKEREGEVGVNVVDGKVMCFDYGLPLKWAHMMLMHSHEAHLFSAVADEPHRKRQFSFEILNSVIDRGGIFTAKTPAGMSLVEIDSSKDIPKACQVS